MQKNSKKKSHRGFFIALSILFLIAMGFCIWYVWAEYQYFKAEEEMNIELQEDVITEPELPDVTVEGDAAPESEYPEGDVHLLREIDWDALKAINPDICAWLYIPGTVIDFPVLQEQTVGKSYYLNHDYRKRFSYNGSILTPKIPGDVPDAHTLLFGHHMVNKSVVFGSLPTTFNRKAFAEAHPYMYLYYPDRTERWQVWCAVDGNADNKVYEIPYELGSADYDGLIGDIASRTKYTCTERPNQDIRITVLSTCNGRAGGKVRFYVVYVPSTSYPDDSGNFYKIEDESEGEQSEDSDLVHISE